MEEIIKKLLEISTDVAVKIILAIVVYIIGRIIISKILKIINNIQKLKNQDETLRKFINSATKFLLYLILIITVITILGIPTTSVIALLASSGLAIGMALQGALGNLAGGIMLMIFKPFAIGDSIKASEAEGYVKEITLFYTVLTTLDKKTITIPNGNLMNANIINNSKENIRMVDMTFSCGRKVDIDEVKNIIKEIMDKNEKILKEPDALVTIAEASDTSYKIIARPYCERKDYWDIYYYMNEEVYKAFKNNNIEVPTIKVTNE